VSKIVVVTSGKGGVGKTTTSAAFAAGLAKRGFRTAVVDFDVGLRNLDLIMGCERRVVFDLIDVINGDAKLNQALIKDKRVDGLQVLATSQTRDKDALTREGVEQVLEELRKEFDYIICDSPAGIEHGAQTALYFADEAIVVTNPEVSSIRDSDRMVGILASKSRRAERNEDPVRSHVLITRYDLERVKRGEMLKVEDVIETHGAVEAAIVVGVPDDEWGERVAAVVVPAVDGLDADGVRAHCRDRLARYAVPKTVVFADALERTASGTVDREWVREYVEARSGK
jgi:septum site-determining protein MinD